jgi:hypothetical protein
MEQQEMSASGFEKRVQFDDERPIVFLQEVFEKILADTDLGFEFQDSLIYLEVVREVHEPPNVEVSGQGTRSAAGGDALGCPSRLPC